jgi:RNA recognition motif-containing protein
MTGQLLARGPASCELNGQAYVRLCTSVPGDCGGELCSSVQKPEEPKRENVKPTTTLFVVNFDSRRVRESDLQDYFCKWGRLIRVEIKKNYAFIQYGSLADAKYALSVAHNSDFMGRRLSVEYVANEDPTVRRGGDDSYERARSPVRGRYATPVHVMLLPLDHQWFFLWQVKVSAAAPFSSADQAPVSVAVLRRAGAPPACRSQEAQPFAPGPQ